MNYSSTLFAWPLSSWWLLLDLVIIVTLLPQVILQRRESGATLAWVLVIVLVPFLGLLGFWLFGTTPLRMRRRKRRRVEERLAPSLSRLQASISVIPSTNEAVPHPTLRQLARRLDGHGPIGGNHLTLYRNGVAAFDALQRAFDEARHHIHLVYYIWQTDATGARLSDALAQAARRGVEVRLLVDDVGSRQTRGGFFSSLVVAGAQVERFLPVNPLSRQLNLNNRNHRKIAVIDGVAAFTGGMNVGDAYAGRGEPWLDLHARVDGPVAHSLQEIFCQDWFHATAEDLASDAYFPPARSDGAVLAQFIASGPADGRWRSIHTFLFAAINLASERIWIETPYFVPDRPIAMALQTAALRGVEVRLLLPGRSDHWLVSLAAASFFDELLDAGVRIFQIWDSMPHAKSVVIDGVVATLGSANMDQRSFRLNFEANMIVFDLQMAQQLEQGYSGLCACATELKKARRRKLKKSQRLLEGAARILAPLL